MPYTVFNIDMVPLDRLSRDRVCQYLYFHVGLHVRHRLVPTLRCFSSHLCRPRPIPGCWRHDRSRYTDVQESGCPLGFDCAGCHQRYRNTDPVCSVHLGAKPAEEKQMGYGYFDLRGGPHCQQE